MSTPGIHVFWFRRDLRPNDNHGLYRALTSGAPVLPLFIFDIDILGRLEDRDDRRVSFIHERVAWLHGAIAAKGGNMQVMHGSPEEVFRRLIATHRITAVYTNHDHEPYARRRDEAVAGLLAARGIAFHSFKDQVIFERDEVVKDDGTPYTVFTPYGRKWRSALARAGVPHHPSEEHLDRWAAAAPLPMPAIEDIGFVRADHQVAGIPPSPGRLQRYAAERDLPAKDGSTGIGVHLRFGTVSVREMVRLAMRYSDGWLNELIWREFFMQVLWHFPHVEHGAFRPAYDRIAWRNDPAHFAAWCEGRTGYPLVDAGMRQLRATGHMHNRVRMVAASFLTKHLLVDRRLGEAWFARWLMDFDLAANNGNWQWAAGTGCDAAPYFRIFDPTAQLRRFDSALDYVKRWAPEHAAGQGPRPIVDHATARKRALDTYRSALGERAVRTAELPRR